MEGFVSFSTSLWFLPLTLLALGLVLVFLRPWSRGSARADGWRVPGEGVCPIAQCDFAEHSSAFGSGGSGVQVPACLSAKVAVEKPRTRYSICRVVRLFSLFLSLLQLSMVVNGMCQTLPFSTLGATRQWSSGLKDSLVSGFVAAVTLQWGGHDGILAVEDYWDYSVICGMIVGASVLFDVLCWYSKSFKRKSSALLLLLDVVILASCSCLPLVHLEQLLHHQRVVLCLAMLVAGCAVFTRLLVLFASLMTLGGQSHCHDSEATAGLGRKLRLRNVSQRKEANEEINKSLENVLQSFSTLKIGGSTSDIDQDCGREKKTWLETAQSMKQKQHPVSKQQCCGSSSRESTCSNSSNLGTSKPSNTSGNSTLWSSSTRTDHATGMDSPVYSSLGMRPEAALVNSSNSKRTLLLYNERHHRPRMFNYETHPPPSPAPSPKGDVVLSWIEPRAAQRCERLWSGVNTTAALTRARLQANGATGGPLGGIQWMYASQMSGNSESLSFFSYQKQFFCDTNEVKMEH